MFPHGLPSFFCSGISCLGEIGNLEGVLPGTVCVCVPNKYKSMLVLEGLRVAKEEQVMS